MGYYIDNSINPCRRIFRLALCLCLFLSIVCAPSQACAWGEFTIKDEAELGKKIRVYVHSLFSLVDDPEIVRYVDKITSRLLAQAPPQPFTFTISVIHNNALNAFAVPGGNLFVYTGLILAVDHESELAGVIGHEIAHATQRHIAGRIEKMQKISLLSLAGALAGAVIGRDAGAALMAGSVAAGQASMLQYSRADETDADHVGLTYLLKAGYPPMGLAGGLRKIQRQQWQQRSGMPTYLSTHPDIGDRISGMTARLQNMPANQRAMKEDDAEFLRIQTLIRARYADVEPAFMHFSQQRNTPQKCLALMGEGMLHSRLNRVPEADGAFASALACDAREGLIVREAGIFHYLKGNPQKAAGLLQQAVRMNPKDDMALFFHARALADSGRIKEAQDFLRDILIRLPEDVEVHQHYAKLLARDKNMFLAYLHMAYSSLYENNRRRTEQNYKQAKDLARSDGDAAELKRFEAAYKERREVWGGRK